MKNFWLRSFPFFFFVQSVWSQSTGDYRTAAAAVDWGTASDWQMWDGSKWSNSATPPGATNIVFIQAGHTTTLNGDQSCLDLYISSGTTDATTGGDGLVALQTYQLNLEGKLSCYIGVVNTTLNSTSALSITSENNTPTLPISKASGGKLKFVGNTRNLTLANEWGGNASGSVSLFDVEIALSTGQTATLNTIVKAANWLISSGKLSTAYRIAADNNTAGQGDLTISAGAVLSSSVSGGGTTPVISRTTSSICGAITVNGTLQLEGLSPYIQCASYTIGADGIVEYNRSGNQNFLGYSFTNAVNLLSYKHIVLSASGTKTTQASLSTELSDNGSLNMQGGTLAIGASGSFSVSSTGTTLKYSAAGAQTASAVEWLTNFQNLTITNSSGLSIGGLSRTINGILDLSIGTFSNSSTLTMGNGATINKTGGALNASPNFGSTVNVSYNQFGASISTGFEIPTNTTVLNNLTINSSNGVALSASITVNGVLSLTNGIVNSTASNLLIMETAASVTGSSNSSFVLGLLSKKTSTTSNFVFPVGKGNILRSLTISPSTSNLTTFTAEYFNTAYSNISTFTSPITRVSTLDYFELSRSTSGTPSDATIALAWGSNSGVNTANVNELSLARFDGGTWVNVPASGSGNANAGLVTSTSSVSAFGTFILANASTNNNPLPVTYIYFRAKLKNGAALLEWATAFENNCLGYEVQKSGVGPSFETISFVKSKSLGGSSSQNLYYAYHDNNPHHGVSFYRLKQMDYDGEVAYSSIQPLVNAKKIAWRIAGDYLIIDFEDRGNTIKILNELGQVVINKEIYESRIIDLGELRPGVYFFQIDQLKPMKFLKI